MSAALVTRKLCLVIVSVMPVMSVSWNASRADQRCGHLAGDADQRNRIHHRGGDAGDQVGGAGAGGRERDADLAAGARVAVGHVRGALFVADQHVANRVVEQRVVGRQNRAARIAEDGVHALFHQDRPDDVSATLFHKMSNSASSDARLGYATPSMRAARTRRCRASCVRIRSISSLPSSRRCREASSMVKRFAQPERIAHFAALEIDLQLVAVCRLRRGRGSCSTAASAIATGSRPLPTALLRKMSANDGAITARKPASCSAHAACSRDEPQPKFDAGRQDRRARVLRLIQRRTPAIALPVVKQERTEARCARSASGTASG